MENKKYSSCGSTSLYSSCGGNVDIKPVKIKEQEPVKVKTDSYSSCGGGSYSSCGR